MCRREDRVIRTVDTVGFSNQIWQWMTQRSKRFGNLPFIGLGDFRQIPPVVENASSPAEVEQHTVRHANNWHVLAYRKLSQPLRILDAEYGALVDNVGDGTVPAIAGSDTIALHGVRWTTDFEEVLAHLYPPGLPDEKLAHRHILAPHAATVKVLNSWIQAKRKGGPLRTLEGRTFLDPDDPHDSWANKNLQRLSMNNVPDHVLQLKEGDLCTLMRAVSRENRLLNNSKVFVRRITKHFVYVQPVDEEGLRDFIHPLPKFLFKFAAPKFGMPVNRRQFPLRLSYAMTVNRAQGQTFHKCAVDVRADPFSHGQLYVALGRVRRGEDMLLFTTSEHTYPSPTQSAVCTPRMKKRKTSRTGTEPAECRCAVCRNVVYRSLLTVSADAESRQAGTSTFAALPSGKRRHSTSAAGVLRRARVDAIIAERSAPKPPPTTWLEAAQDEGHRQEQEVDKRVRKNKALLVSVDTSTQDMDDAEYHEWLPADDAAACPSVPHGYFQRQWTDSLCGVYALNHVLGGPYITEESANAGADLVAEELEEDVAVHRDVSGTDGELGGDYSLAALSKALGESTNFNVDFVSVGDRIGNGNISSCFESVHYATGVRGYLVHRRHHWTGIYFAQDGVAWYYDSLEDGPRQLDPSALDRLLKRKAFQVYEYV